MTHGSRLWGGGRFGEPASEEKYKAEFEAEAPNGVLVV